MEAAPISCPIHCVQLPDAQAIHQSENDAVVSIYQVHTSSHAACCNHFRWSSSNPRRCNMHSCNNQSINQSIIHSALQKITSWVMSFVFFADALKSWTFAAYQRQPLSCDMFFRSCKQRHLLQPMSSEPRHYYNGVSIIRCSMENTENFASFQPNNTKKQSVACFERMFIFMLLQYIAYTGSTYCIKP